MIQQRTLLKLPLMEYGLEGRNSVLRRDWDFSVRRRIQICSMVPKLLFLEIKRPER
jgi:hypothetical protein